MNHTSIQWNQIIDGYRGFERLAVDYVQDKEKTSAGWEHTKETRDGNHDAKTIVLGYLSPDGEETEWWMEAKYSTQSIRLSRYRLDATIVSAILHGHVSKVIFVTNIEIGTKAILDIQKALQESTKCKETIFYTKKHLEYWLVEEYSRYCKYFPAITQDQFAKLEPPNLLALEFPEFFPAGSIFKEPVTLLYSGHFYVCYFSLFCKDALSAKFRCSNRNIYFIDENRKKKRCLSVELEAGIKHLEIELYIRPQIKPGEHQDAVWIQIGDQESLFPDYPVAVADNRGAYLKIESQLLIEKELVSSWKRFFKGKDNDSFHRIVGASGCGKSFIAQNFLDRIYHCRNGFFLSNFTELDRLNGKILLEFIFYLLFPFLPPQEMDEEYLSSLGLSLRKREVLTTLLKASDNTDLFLSAIKNFPIFEELFPYMGEGRKRMILLDDIHKLRAEHSQFLFALLKLLKLQGYPIFVILIGQNRHGWEGYEELKQEVYFRNYFCKIQWDDLLKYISPMNMNIARPTAENLFGSVIELLYFLKYVYLLEDSIQTVEQFWLAYHTFKNVKMFQEYVSDIFHQLFLSCAQDPTVQDLCIFVYYSPQLLTNESLANYRSELFTLFQNGVIKINANGNIVPYHDIYREIFLRTYDPILRNPLNIPMSQLSRMQWNIMSQPEENLLLGYLPEIDQLIRQQSFHTVYQLLFYLFQDEQHQERYYKICSRETFCRLYWNFAYASTNVSVAFSGSELFTKVRDAAAGPGTGLAVIRILTEFELMNSYYEHLNFSQAMENYRRMEHDFKLLPKDLQVPYKQNLITAHQAAYSILLLIQLEKNDGGLSELKGESQWRAILTTTADKIKYRFELLRIAMALSVHDFTSAWGLIETCRNLDKQANDLDYKASGMILFVYHYFRYAVFKDELLGEVIQAHNNLKENFNNDYRRHLPAVAGLYYMKNMIEEGNAAMLEVIDSKRKLRPRQQAIFDCIEAIAALLNPDRRDPLYAEKKLQSAKKIFVELPSYLKVVEHNLKFLEKHWLNPENLDFFYGQTMIEDQYYIDIRYIY